MREPVRVREACTLILLLSPLLIPSLAAHADGPTDATLNQTMASAPQTGTVLSGSVNLSNLPVTSNGSTAALGAVLGAAIAAAAAAQTTANGAVQSSGGNVTNTTFLPAGARQPASLGGKLTQMPDPKDYGATGNAVRGVLFQPAQAGDTAITVTATSLSAGILVASGWQVYAVGGLLSSSTTVTAVTQVAAVGGAPATTLITLSSPLLAAVPLTSPGNVYFDFSPHDDTAAFQAAYAAALAQGQSAVHVGPGLYGVHMSLAPTPAVSWVLDNASLAQGSAINDGPNAGAEQSPSGQTLLKTLNFPGNESGLQVDLTFAQTSSTQQYQKNAANFYFNDSDSGCFQTIDDAACSGSDGSADIVRAAVGVSIQGQFGPLVTQGSMFGQESLIQVPAGTDGTVTNDEASLVNNATRAAPYLGDILNKEVVTFLSSGTTPVSDTVRVGGVSPSMNGIWIDAAQMVENALVVGTDSGRNAEGTGMGYSALAWIGHGGDIFGSSAHFGGGPATATAGAAPVLPATDGRTLPTGGLAIDGGGNLATTGTLSAAGLVNASAGVRAGAGTRGLGGVAVSLNPVGQIDIGNSTLPAGPSPTINFHRPAASGSDAFDLQIIDAGGALRASDGAGNQLFYASASGGLAGTQLVATTTSGVAATFDGARAVGSLLFYLTQSGFDMLQETGTQSIYVKTAGGYNAQFNADGSTTLGGPLAQTAANSLAGTGTMQLGATPLSKHVNLITSCASGATAFVLPPGAAAGSASEVKLLNRSGNACLVFPATGGAIESGGTNVSVELASGVDTVFSSLSPTQWYQ